MTQIVSPTIAFRDKNQTSGSSFFRKVKLTAQQMQLWDETRTAVLWAQPSFADIWYAMMTDPQGQLAYFTDQVPVAATDDTYMFINPDTFFKYSLEERVFICLHEICHAVFNHCGLSYRLEQAGEVRYSDGVTIPFHGMLMGYAADFVINAILVADDVGKAPADACHDPKIIPPTMSMLDAYRLLYKKCGKRGRRPGDQPGGGGGGSDTELPRGKRFDKHLAPGEGRGKTPSQAESDRNPQAWTNAINAALESGKLAGKLPANIAKLFQATLEVPTNWQEQMCIQVGKALGRDRYNWEYLDPELMVRGIGFPGRVRYGCEHVILAVDSSGSTYMSEETINMFLSNIANIIETVKPRRITYCECDTMIHVWKDIESIDDLLDASGKIKVLGGGGTEFRPVFDRIAKEDEHPDVLLYLTDLYGDVPEQEPNYPVIWGCVTDQKAPWGNTVYIPPQASAEEKAQW